MSKDTMGGRSMYAWCVLERWEQCPLQWVSCCLHAATWHHLHWVRVHETLIGVPTVKGHSGYLHNAFCFVQ